MRSSRVSVGSADNFWKHLTRQAPILEHDFSGQSGQDFAGLWQGVSPIATEAADAVPPAVRVEITGTTTTAPTMATRPRTKDQRWNSRFFKDLEHNACLDCTIIAELYLPASKFGVICNCWIYKLGPGSVDVSKLPKQPGRSIGNSQVSSSALG